MRQDTWNTDYGPFRGFYRDRENGWIFGVCAGLADRFNLPELLLKKPSTSMLPPYRPGNYTVEQGPGGIFGHCHLT